MAQFNSELSYTHVWIIFGDLHMESIYNRHAIPTSVMIFLWNWLFVCWKRFRVYVEFQVEITSYVEIANKIQRSAYVNLKRIFIQWLMWLCIRLLGQLSRQLNVSAYQTRYHWLTDFLNNFSVIWYFLAIRHEAMPISSNLVGPMV